MATNILKPLYKEGTIERNRCWYWPLSLSLRIQKPIAKPFVNIHWEMDVDTRETREGWPLLTVETEANGDSWSIYERGPSLVGSLGSSCRYNSFLSCLGGSSQPIKKYYFPNRTLFHFIRPHRPATWQAVVLGRLSLCLWLILYGPSPFWWFYNNIP